MLECCIVFHHHRDDRTTRAHLDLLRRLNPYPVVAITGEPGAALAGSFDAAPPDRVSAGSAWSHCDLPTYRWYNGGGLRAERYVLTEWDTHASLPVRDFFAEVWDQDVAARGVATPAGDPGWVWFAEVDRLPPDLRPFAAGVWPLGCLLLSDRALGTVAATPHLPDVYSELRLGTLLRRSGFPLTALPAHRARTIDWHPDRIAFDPQRPAIYHPVKSLPPSEPPTPSAGG